MTEALATDLVVEPAAVAAWLDVEPEWIATAITQGLPVLGYRSDGVPLVVVGEVRAWLRRPTLDDDAT
ncbi:MAG: hypothetical protein QOC54_2060 [Baekduia sp.]|nr:hypothetical protein [Baekduia sp.]